MLQLLAALQSAEAALTSGNLNIRTLRLQVGQTNIERRAHRAEKFAARKTLVPVLQAEEDRR